MKYTIATQNGEYPFYAVQNSAHAAYECVAELSRTLFRDYGIDLDEVLYEIALMSCGKVTSYFVGCLSIRAGTPENEERGSE